MQSCIFYLLISLGTIILHSSENSKIIASDVLGLGYILGIFNNYINKDLDDVLTYVYTELAY